MTGSHLKFATVSGSCWPTAWGYITDRDLDVVFVQETRLAGQDLIDDKVNPRRAGWQSYWAEAYRSTTGQACAGVAILARAHLDAWQPVGQISGLVCPHRVVCCMRRTRSLGMVVLYS